MIDPRQLDDEALDALLREALSRAGEPAPFAVDVADAVMTRVAAIGPAPRNELGWRQFGRWAAAASVLGTALVVAAAWHAPTLGDIVHGLGRTTAATAGAAADLSKPAGTVATALAAAAMSLMNAAREVAGPFASINPLAEALLAAVTAAMLGITTFVVGRDLRSGDATKEQA